MNTLALGIGADQVTTVAEADRPEVKMVGAGQPVLWWDADIVDPEIAQLVRFGRACQNLGLDMEDAGDA